MVHFFGISVSSSLLAWIVIGLLAGWIAGLLSRGAGFGCLGNIRSRADWIGAGRMDFLETGHLRRRLGLQPGCRDGRGDLLVS